MFNFEENKLKQASIASGIKFIPPGKQHLPPFKKKIDFINKFKINSTLLKTFQNCNFDVEIYVFM